MKDDFISRQAAIDTLLKLYEYQRDIDPTEAADLVRQGVFLATKKIEQLPPAQQWIPCSERLPEHNQICIVTDETRRCAYEYGFHDETYDSETGWTYLGHRIIAWMPLPEPYKADKEAENGKEIQ